MRAQGTSGARPPGPPDRELWRRSQEIEAASDEAEDLMALAAFADNRLDDDDTGRMAALIARDADLTADVGAARTLGAAVMVPADERIVRRAAALVDGALPEAHVIAFPNRRSMVRPWYSAVSWSGLAAAVVLAGWLGFDLGAGLSNAPPFGSPTDEASTADLFDPAPLLLREFTESSQI